MPQSPLENVKAHWSKLVENCQTSPKDYYLWFTLSWRGRGAVRAMPRCRIEILVDSRGGPIYGLLSSETPGR